MIIRQDIQLTSPTGKTFHALWRAGTLAGKKRTGIFEIFGVDGAVIQDLGASPREIPLTLFFDGPHAASEALSFEGALKERGPWEVLHPLLGPLSLQPVSYSLKLDGVESISPVECSLSCIESKLATSLSKALSPELATDSSLELTGALLDNLESFPENLSDIQTSVSGLLGEMTPVLLGVLPQVSKARNLFAGTLEGLEELLFAPASTPMELVGVLLNLIQTPFRLVSNLRFSLESVRQLMQISERSSTSPALKTIFSVAIFQSACAVVRTFPFEESIGPPLEACVYASGVISSLQKKILATPSSLFSSLMKLSSATQRYLVHEGLRILTKRKVMREPTPPIKAVLQEYHTLGQGEKLLERFVRANRLVGQELLLIPEGREVFFHVA